MNILLIVPKSERVPIVRTSYSPPLGLMSIGASIKKYDERLSVKILNGELMARDEELIESILENEPDIVGISTNVGCYRAALALAKEIKEKRSDVLIVLGGPYISTMWKECLLNREYIDCCVVADGEIPMVEIIKGIPLSEIPGVAARNGHKKPTLNEPKYFPLDDYPDPDWSLVDARVYQDSYREIYQMPEATFASINAQKGCKWRVATGGCIFCGLVRPSVRTRSPERVWSEIKSLNSSLGCNHFWELSDSICSNKSWLEEFYALKPLKSGFFFRGYARASEINSNAADLLKNIGFEEMFIGIESGDDKVLKASSKGSTAKINLRATQTLAARGIKTFASIVLGLPGESLSSLERTYNHVLNLFENGLYTLSVCIFAPYPGSKAFQLLLDDETIGPDFRGKDYFDWTEASRIWIGKYCECSFSDIMDYLEKFKQIPSCLYEDNFTYIDKIYDV